MARSGSEDELRLVTQTLASAVSSYKQASKSCKNLSREPKAKGNTSATPPAIADGQV